MNILKKSINKLLTSSDIDSAEVKTLSDKLASYLVGSAFDKCAKDTDRLEVIKFINYVLEQRDDWQK